MCERTISVILPVKSADERLKLTLDSLLAQTDQPGEIVLLCAGAGAEEWRRLLSLQEQHAAIVLVRQHRPGFAAALNAGLALTRGSYFTWLAAGCQLVPEAFAQMADMLAKRDEVGLAFGQCPHTGAPEMREEGQDEDWAEILLKHNPVGCAFLCRRNSIDRIGKLREDLDGFEAWDYWIRLRESAGITGLPRTLCACGDGCGRTTSATPETAGGRALREHHRRRRAQVQQHGAARSDDGTGRPETARSKHDRGSKILMVAPDFPPAHGFGVGWHIRGLARALSARGCEVHVVTAQSRMPAHMADESIHVHCPDRRPPFSAPTHVSDVLQDQALMLTQALDAHSLHGPFDLVHAHGWTGASVGHSLQRALKLPMVFSLHRLEALESEDRGGQLTSDRLYARETEAWICESADRVICLSRFVAQQARRIYGVQPKRIEVTPIGVEEREWETDADIGAFRGLFGPAQCKFITFAGRLHHSKGPQILVESLPHILAVVPEARVVLAGEGPLEPGLRRRVSDLGLDSVVHFAGYLSGKVLATLLWSSDVHVIPSLVEASGAGATEAMLCGVPVVAAASGGLSELIEHEVNGLLVPPGDVKALAPAIVRVLYDRELAGRLAESGQARIFAGHLWRNVVQATLRVYSQVESAWAST